MQFSILRIIFPTFFSSRGRPLRVLYRRSNYLRAGLVSFFFDLVVLRGALKSISSSYVCIPKIAMPGEYKSPWRFRSSLWDAVEI